MNNNKYTREELGFMFLKPIKNELFVQLRERSIFVSNKGRVISTDFQGKGYCKELDLIDTKNGYSVNVRRIGFGSNGERLNKIMAETFLENPDSCKTVRYLDGNYKNCTLDNIYYYHGHKEYAGKKFPKFEIFECPETFPFDIENIGVRAFGIVATRINTKWDKGERMRRIETMHIENVTVTPNGFIATVVDGGAARSEMKMINGCITLKTSWGSCISVGKINQVVSDPTELSLILKTIIRIFSDFFINESPMEMKDLYISQLDYSIESNQGIAA